MKRETHSGQEQTISNCRRLYTVPSPPHMNELQLTHSIAILYEISTNYVSLYDTPLN